MNADLGISETELTVEQLTRRLQLGASKSAEIRNAQIVVAPELNFRGRDDRGFMPETVAFVKFCMQTYPKAGLVVAEETGKENLIALHSADLWLPTLIVEGVVLPLVVNIVWEFLKRFYGREKARSRRVHFKVVVDDRKRKRAMELSYEGPLDGFRDAFARVDAAKLFK